MRLTSTDVSARVFGRTWAHTRTFGNIIQGESAIANGNRWFVRGPFAKASVSSIGWGGEYRLLNVYTDANRILSFGAEAPLYKWNYLFTGNYRAFASGSDLVVKDSDGTQRVFFDPVSGPAELRGRIKKTIYPNGMEETCTYIDGTDLLVEVEQAMGSAAARMTYEWTSTSPGQISKVTLAIGTDEVTSAEYEYYDGTTDKGRLGDLKQVVRKRKIPGTLTWEMVSESFYTYYISGEGIGALGRLKYVLEAEAVARFREANPGEPLDGASPSELADFADYYFEYDHLSRVVREDVHGTLRSYTFSYVPRVISGSSSSSEEENPFPHAFNSWVSKTIETQPDGVTRTAYCNSAGEVMLLTIKDTPNSKIWHIGYRFADNSRVILRASPSAIATVDENWDHLFTIKSNAGLVRHFESVDLNPPVDTIVKIRREFVSEGNVASENWIKVRERKYVRHTVGDLTKDFLASDTKFQSTGDLAPATTTYQYEWHTGTFAISKRTTIWPVVTETVSGVGQNGSGTAAEKIEFFNIEGHLTWLKDESGYITCHTYTTDTGTRLETIQDVDTTKSGLPPDLPCGWAKPSDGGLHLITNYEHDAYGRLTQRLGPVHTVSLAGVATNMRRAHWRVYLDGVHQQYLGSGYATGTSSYTYTLVNPVTYLWLNHAGQVIEDIRATRASTTGRLSRSDTFASSTWFARTEYGYDNALNLSWRREYHNVAGSQYHQTDFAYDLLNRLVRVKAAGGTIRRFEYDARGLETSRSMGTNDTGSNNMKEQERRKYDGLPGLDGYLTEVVLYPSGTAGQERVTTYGYDFRGRRTSLTGPQSTYFGYSYDNLGRLTTTQQKNNSSSGSLLAQSAVKYDNRGRVYEREQFSVAGGVAGSSLREQFWYEPRGRVMKWRGLNGQGFVKRLYDGVKRIKVQFVACGGGTETYAQAGTVAGNMVLQQSEFTHDDASNLIFWVDRERNHNATGNGELLLPSSTQRQARVTYQALYSDPVGRRIATANYGTNGAVAVTRSATVPGSTDTCLVSLIRYNENRGNVEETVAPDEVLPGDGIVTRTEYNALGLQVKVIEDHGTGRLNRTTEFVYNADNNLWKLIAWQGSSATLGQTTEWVYGTTLPASEVASNELVVTKKYPDGGGDEVHFRYDRLGYLTHFTDQAGTVHEYLYDKLGRQLHDKVTALGTGVDDSVRRISYAYDSRGNLNRITSSSNPSEGVTSVVNEVIRSMNGFGQITAEYQAHGGAASGASPKTSYEYNDGSSNTIRRKNTIYPSGRQIQWLYGTTNSIDDLMDRVSQVYDYSAAQALVNYQRRGIRSTVSITYPEPQVDMTYVGTPGDGGDQYAGLDRFNRIIDIPWKKTSPSTMLDRYQYGFNRASNRLWRRNVVAAGLKWDEHYTYDRVYQMTQLDRGNLLSPPTDGISGTPAWEEDFTFDSLGNWLTYTTSGTSSLTQTRTHNKANEITGITPSTPTSVQPVYDAAGNMTKAPKAGAWGTDQTFKWDAWNRLVEVTQGTTTVVGKYRYDGLFRRIVKESTEAGLWTVRHYYYSNEWQVLEERVDAWGAVPERQFVWGQRYPDDLVLRDRYPAEPSSSSEWSALDDQFLTSSSSSEDEAERLYATHDQWHVTSIIDRTGAVQERYAYSGYGQSIVLSPTFAARTASLFDWETRYGAYRFDSETGLYQVRFRYLHPALGRWLSRDPIQERAGLNFFAFTLNNPIFSQDVYGLQGEVHYNDGKFRIDSELFADGNNMHIQCGKQKFMLDSNGQFTEKKTGAGFPRSLMKKLMKNPEFVQGMKDAADRVNAAGGLAPKYGGKPAIISPLAVVGLALGAAGLAGVCQEYIKAVEEGNVPAAMKASEEISKAVDQALGAAGQGAGVMTDLMNGIPAAQIK